jgi:hypothetical protein
MGCLKLGYPKSTGLSIIIITYCILFFLCTPSFQTHPYVNCRYYIKIHSVLTISLKDRMMSDDFHTFVHYFAQPPGITRDKLGYV